MGFDLHIHSIYSDGAITPRELIAEAKRKGLSGIALTDHDTVDGLDEAVRAAQQENFCLIPGIELTTDYGKVEAHILGYNFDFHAPKLLRKLELILSSRKERVLEMIKRLKRHRVALDWEDVQALTGSRFIGRSQVFRAMENRGYVDRTRRKEVFEYYLGKNGVAYVPHREIETREAIELINENGGIPVLAHPGRAGADSIIARLAGYGLKGLEVYYPAHTPELTAHYLKMAERYRLLATGGSDYHGKTGQPGMGEAVVAELPFECGPPYFICRD
jgi:predicted metal-dependent phosphoesterase TrpH